MPGRPFALSGVGAVRGQMGQKLAGRDEAKDDKSLMEIHQKKGTIRALRNVVEPFGYLIRVVEWWQENGTPGTFRLEIGASEDGIDADTYYEMERLIADARPVSRHLVGLNIILEATGEMFTGGASYTGDIITSYAE
ncbi:Phage tail fiber [Salmonella bongori N268-08]|uniref:Phage tail fiber n=1 Tax=Salmonella bongori N268-08 TaxID=1197719 RepID=S5MV89_SALBN|nr:Phage tail fiber [Salmonella bongori N268-08]